MEVAELSLSTICSKDSPSLITRPYWMGLGMRLKLPLLECMIWWIESLLYQSLSVSFVPRPHPKSLEKGMLTLFSGQLWE